MTQKIIKARQATKSRTSNKGGLFAKVAKVGASQKAATLPDFKAGDTVRVHVLIKEGDKERTQAFDGTVICRHNEGANKTFVVRKISHGVGVERIFSEKSPKVAKLEVLQTGRVRRAKLYYIRELQGRAARIDRDMDAEVAAPTAAPTK